MTLNRALLTVTATLMAACGMSSATTFTSVQAGDWRTPSTWDRNSSYPQAGDTVIIHHDVAITHVEAAGDMTIELSQANPHDATPSLTISSGVGARSLTVDAFQVDPAGTVVIGADTTFTLSAGGTGAFDGDLYINGGKLEVGGSSAYTTVSAVIYMQGDYPVLTVNSFNGVRLQSGAAIEVDATSGTGFAKINGSGSVEGLADNPIDINMSYSSGTVLLELEDATLNGRLVINQGAGSGDSAFWNYGFVSADAAPGGSRTLVIGAGLDTVLDNYGDCSSFQWQVASGCTLAINQSLNLEGSFNVSGNLCITGTVVTDGYRSGSGSVTCGTLSPTDNCP